MRTILKHRGDRRFAFPMTMIIVAALAGISGRDLYAQYDPQSLRAVAVHVLQDPPQPWTGYGIYLRDGLVITAAHVVGAAAHAKPSIRIADQLLPARVLKESPFEKDDLTLLGFEGASLPVSLRLRRTPLCEDAPIVDEPVPGGHSGGNGALPHHVAQTSSTRIPSEVCKRHSGCCNDRQFGLRRVSRWPQMPARHHEPQDPGQANRRSFERAEGSRQILCP